jgi:[ribosomal protein S18]-alanine N-acetyltransferase
MIWPFAKGAAVIRLLLAQDAENCARLHRTGFAYPWSMEDFENLLNSPSVSGSLACLPNAAALGFVLARRAADEAEILTLVVRPDHRRRGLGYDLLKEQLARLASAGTRTVVLEVDEQNVAARTLYERYGFERIGARPAYYRLADGARSSALIMRCRL